MVHRTKDRSNMSAFLESPSLPVSLSLVPFLAHVSWGERKRMEQRKDRGRRSPTTTLGCFIKLRAIVESVWAVGSVGCIIFSNPLEILVSRVSNIANSTRVEAVYKRLWENDKLSLSLILGMVGTKRILPVFPTTMNTS